MTMTSIVIKHHWLADQRIEIRFPFFLLLGDVLIAVLELFHNHLSQIEWHGVIYMATKN